jgi:dolichol-phosphate mannosyltransferase
VLRLGFNPVFIPYDRPLGKNKYTSRWTLKKKIKLAKDTFYSSSSFPIKFITNLGLLTALFSFFVLIFYVYIYIYGNKAFWGITIPGWTSIVVFISFFSGIILISLGVIAEYIWRIYEEVKARPGYIIKRKDE